MNTYETARMGYGEADITPDTVVELVGFFRPDNHSRGIRDPLKLQTMVWEYGGRNGLSYYPGQPWFYRPICPMPCGASLRTCFIRVPITS